MSKIAQKVSAARADNANAVLETRLMAESGAVLSLSVRRAALPSGTAS